MIHIEPAETRYLTVWHSEWDAKWALQLPESIASATGWIMDFQPIHPEWRQASDGGWHYDWQADEDYLRAQEGYRQADTSGNLAHKIFRAGLALHTAIAPLEKDALALELRLTNGSDSTFTRVCCDGGCFQAKSPVFAGPDEIARTYLMVAGGMCSMQRLSRTEPIRCTYHCDPTDYEQPPTNDGEWFWGRSSDTPDCPVIVGMESVCGSHAVVLGYEGARSASANADEHHCIHSRPFFGDIAPGQSVTRRGCIQFGSDVHTMASELSRRLASLD